MYVKTLIKNLFRVKYDHIRSDMALSSYIWHNMANFYRNSFIGIFFALKYFDKFFFYRKIHNFKLNKFLEYHKNFSSTQNLENSLNPITFFHFRDELILNKKVTSGLNNKSIFNLIISFRNSNKINCFLKLPVYRQKSKSLI